jgi:quinolinate synthase
MDNSALIEKILRLKRERNAVILAHNYQRGEVQDIADELGDSLDLSRKGAASRAGVIVFCGVYFMAEVAATLSPRKTVLMPDLNAGCALADMITPRQLKEARAAHPDAAVVCYINSPAAIKALSDVVCTSANAVKIVERLPAGQEVLFVPDRNLGRWVARRTGRKMIFWDGYCPTHRRFNQFEIERARRDHPGAPLMAHPECEPEVLEAADLVAGTSGMLRWVRESAAREFIVATEEGMLHRLRKENPEKRFYGASLFGDCPDMKLTTLEKILWSLEEMVYRVSVEEKVRAESLRSLEKMLAWS